MQLDIQLDPNPVFRKVITPWYDSRLACWLLILSMIPVFFFAVSGVMMAANTPALSRHMCFPLLLAGLSGFLIIKVYVRLRPRKR